MFVVTSFENLAARLIFLIHGLVAKKVASDIEEMAALRV